MTNKQPLCRGGNKGLQVGWNQTAPPGGRVHEGSLPHPQRGKGVLRPPWGLVGGCVGRPFSDGNSVEGEWECCTDTFRGQ